MGQQKYDLITMGNNPASIFIGGDIGELHVIGGKLSNYHLKWDHRQKMIKLNKFKFSGIVGHCLLHINNEWHESFKSKLLLFGGYTKFLSSKSYTYSDHILCCDINESSNSCSWTGLNSSYSSFATKRDQKVVLPRKLAYFGAVIYKNIFVIIFGGTTIGNKKLNDIWYLNINSMKWRHSAVKCPIKARGYHAILTNNNIIHLFQRDSNKHFTIKVDHIISQNELNSAENQQETAYKVIKQSLQK